MIMVGTAIMVVGATLQASASTLGHFTVGRIITGLGNGANTSTVGGFFRTSQSLTRCSLKLSRCQHGSPKPQNRISVASSS